MQSVMLLRDCIPDRSVMKTKTKIMMLILVIDAMLVIDYIVESRIEKTVMNMLTLLQQCF